MRSFPQARAMVAALLFGSMLLISTADASSRFQTRFNGQIGNRSNKYVPVQIAVGDVDGDGNLDVVAPGASYGMEVLLGRGDGTLAPPIVFGPSPGEIPYLTLGDFDGDGHLDIGEVASSEAAIYFGDGSGRNWQRLSLPITGYFGMKVVACDVDGDGHSDLVALLQPNSCLGCPPVSGPPLIRTYLSRPGRTFLTVDDGQPLLNMTAVGGFQARDLNRDSKMDLVLTGSYGNAVCTGLGHGDGTFTFNARNDTYGDARGCALGDATGDGKLDLIVACSFALVIYPGAGDGTFGAPQSFFQPGWFESPREVSLADVTGDGIPDLVVSDYDYDDIVLRPGLGGGSYGPPRRILLGCAASPMDLADLNGDGTPDLVGMTLQDDALSSPPVVLVALGDGAGGFGDDRTALPSPNASTWTTGDFDGDGRPDLVSVRSQNPGCTVEVLRNDGARHFIAQPSTSISGDLALPFPVDLDEDGQLDLVTGGTSCQWLRGLGDGTFAAPVTLPTGGSTVLAVADLTEDGHADLVLQAPAGGFRIVPGLGNGAFGVPFDVSVPNLSAGRLLIGDLDGDHHPDLACGGYSPSYYGVEQVIIHGPFYPGMPVVSDAWPETGFGSCVIGDVDGDGRMDLVDGLGAGGYTVLGTVEVRLQQPDGTLGPPVVSSWPTVAVNQLDLVDLDHDGHVDLVGLGDGGWYVGMGDGTGHFTLEGLEASGSGSSIAPHPVDFDGDGRFDLVVNETSAAISSLEICFGRDPVPPTVSNVGPQSSHPLWVGQPMTLAWNASDDVGLGSASGFVSRHGPNGPFEPVGTAPASGGSLAWTVTGPPSDSITFKVLARDLDGNTAWAKSANLRAVLPATAVNDVPASFVRLGLATRVNPAHDHLSLALALPRAGHAMLTLVDVQGRRIATLLDADLPAGATPVDRSLPEAVGHAGLYFVRLECGGEHAFARIAVTR